jgi:hypothetical protein
MNSEKQILRFYEEAAKGFQRWGRLPAGTLKLHRGTGLLSISSMGEDCENGMQRMIRELPAGSENRSIRHSAKRA